MPTSIGRWESMFRPQAAPTPGRGPTPGPADGRTVQRVSSRGACGSVWIRGTFHMNDFGDGARLAYVEASSGGIPCQTKGTRFPART